MTRATINTLKAYALFALIGCASIVLTNKTDAYASAVSEISLPQERVTPGGRSDLLPESTGGQTLALKGILK